MIPEIEKLVDLALLDGQITESERAIIFKKALDLGVDSDQVSLYIENKLSAHRSTTPRSGKEKVGSVRTCPACGTNVVPNSLKCGECGHEFYEVGSNRNLKEFFGIIASVDLSKKATIISTFPIPSSKTDILDFLAFSIGKTKPLADHEKTSYIKNSLTGEFHKELLYREEEIAAWQAKTHEAIAKGRTLFRNDIHLMSQLDEYEKQFRQNKKVGRSYNFSWIFYFVGFAALGILIFLFYSNYSNTYQKEVDRLNRLDVEIQSAIESKNYSKAELLLNSLRYSISTGNDKYETQKWDERRDGYLKLIAQATSVDSMAIKINNSFLSTSFDTIDAMQDSSSNVVSELVSGDSLSPLIDLTLARLVINRYNDAVNNENADQLEMVLSSQVANWHSRFGLSKAEVIEDWRANYMPRWKIIQNEITAFTEGVLPNSFVYEKRYAVISKNNDEDARYFYIKGYFILDNTAKIVEMKDTETKRLQ